MKRLLEEGDELTAKMIAAKQARVDPFMRERVLASLRREKAHRPRRARLWPALAMVLILAAGAASWANGIAFVDAIRRTMARWTTEPSIRAVAPRPSLSPATPQVGEAPVPAPPVTDLVVETPAKELRPRSQRRATMVAPPAGAEDDASLAAQAFAALHNEKHAAAALRLTEAYRQRFPSGALSEEVAALRIEALDELGYDTAIDAARDYLQRYPRGQYASVAEGVLRRAR